MTRLELKNELTRIDGCIEILHGLVTMPLCQCDSHLGGFDEKFREKNKMQLQQLTTVKDGLMSLGDKTDDALEKIPHQPVNCY